MSIVQTWLRTERQGKQELIILKKFKIINLKQFKLI